MRATRARCALGGPIAAALLAAGCLEIPAHAVNDAAIDAADCAGPADDCDDDGWPATSRQAAGADCDDRDPAINPGAFDDPETAADEDCLPDGAAQRLIGVTGNQAGWTSGDLSIAFATMTRMPSSLRIGAVEALASESACEVSDEEGLGVSLYPAFAAHLRTTTPVGDNPVERAGPAMATSLVTWEVTIPSSGSPRCDDPVRQHPLHRAARPAAHPGGHPRGRRRGDELRRLRQPDRRPAHPVELPGAAAVVRSRARQQRR
jgi:hypothetical protein